MSGDRLGHIPFARVEAALRARDLAFIRSHTGEFTLALGDEIEVCRLVAEQDPGALEAASVGWIRRFAGEPVKQERRDYGLIVAAFDTMTARPDWAAEQLVALCAKRGLLR